MKQPSSLCNTVGLIGELLRVHFIKILQFLLFQNFRMKGCNTVYRMAPDNRKMRHLNLSIVDDCHLGNLCFGVSFILFSYIFTETTINLFHNLIDSGKKLGEQLNRPLL